MQGFFTFLATRPGLRIFSVFSKTNTFVFSEHTGEPKLVAKDIYLYLHDTGKFPETEGGGGGGVGLFNTGLQENWTCIAAIMTIVFSL